MNKGKKKTKDIEIYCLKIREIDFETFFEIENHLWKKKSDFRNLNLSNDLKIEFLFSKKYKLYRKIKST
jgi:hypothetical protein